MTMRFRAFSTSEWVTTVAPSRVMPSLVNTMSWAAEVGTVAVRVRASVPSMAVTAR